MKNDDKIIHFDGITRLDLPVDRVIQMAKKEKLDEVVIIGFDPEGEFYFSSSKANGGDVLWLLEKAKQMLLHYES